MSQRISLSAESRQDLREIVDYYEERQENLGQRFIHELVVVLERVVDRPGSFPNLYRDVRRARFDHFPYGVFFRRDSEGVIRVIAIVHLHRHPRAWRGRRK